MKRNTKGAGHFSEIIENGKVIKVSLRKSVGYKSDGKRKVITVTATSRTACMAKMKEKEKEWEAKKNQTLVKGKNTVAELCKKHLDFQVKNGDLKPKSVDRRECTIRNQIEKYPIGSMQIHSLNTLDVELHIKTLINEGKLSPSSIIKVIDVLYAAFEWARAYHGFGENPVKITKENNYGKLKKLSEKGANETDVVCLSDYEVEAFENEALRLRNNGTRYYSAADYLLLLLYTGMRCGELFALRWRDVDWDEGYITINKSTSMAKNRRKLEKSDNNYVMIEGSTKNQKARTIKLSQKAMDVLVRIYQDTKWRGLDDHIATTKTGNINTASNLAHRQKIIQKNAGLEEVEGGLHTFRKTFATQMYRNGCTIDAIAAYIGDLVSTTRKYYISDREKVRTSAGVKYIVKLE